MSTIRLKLIQNELSKILSFNTPNLTLLHSERPKLYTMLALLSATGLKVISILTLLHSKWPKLYGVLAILSTIGLKLIQNEVSVLIKAHSFIKPLLEEFYFPEKPYQNWVYSYRKEFASRGANSFH